jgi:C-terminal processing protease CtpA/Prc
MLAKTPIVLETEGLGRKEFHGKVILLVNRHTASAAEMIVAFARENNLARIVGEKTAGKLLSATSVKVGQGFRLALPTGAYYTWKGSVLEGTPIEPDELVEFDWQTARSNKNRKQGQQLEYAIESGDIGVMNTDAGDRSSPMAANSLNELISLVGRSNARRPISATGDDSTPNQWLLS